MVTAILNESLEEEIYMKPHPMTFNLFPPNKVLRLNKALYGLNNLQVLNCEVDPCLYMFLQDNLITYIAAYVGELLIVSNSPTEQMHLATSLSFSFELRDLGFPPTFVGIQLVQRDGTLFIH